MDTRVGQLQRADVRRQHLLASAPVHEIADHREALLKLRQRILIDRKLIGITQYLAVGIALWLAGLSVDLRLAAAGRPAVQRNPAAQQVGEQGFGAGRAGLAVLVQRSQRLLGQALRQQPAAQFVALRLQPGAQLGQPRLVDQHTVALGRAQQRRDACDLRAVHVDVAGECAVVDQLEQVVRQPHVLHAVALQQLGLRAPERVVVAVLDCPRYAVELRCGGQRALGFGRVGAQQIGADRLQPVRLVALPAGQGDARKRRHVVQPVAAAQQINNAGRPQVMNVERRIGEYQQVVLCYGGQEAVPALVHRAEVLAVGVGPLDHENALDALPPDQRTGLGIYG